MLAKKKVFKNLSNVVGNQKILAKQSMKRTLETSPRVDKVKKKNVKNDENHLAVSTSSIENKIRRIHISEPGEVKCKAVVVASKTRVFKPETVTADKYYQPPALLPANVVDYDKTQLNNIDCEPIYAYDIFQYFRQKELSTKCEKYLDKQPELSEKMRVVLVDWMVEVQQSFELNHETLYMAVKIVDHFLMRSFVSRARFQLLGLTAILIAAKVDERVYPIIDDFVYICDDAYDREGIIEMEIEILKVLDFQLNYPLSYSFLRRYARCSSQSIETLTLSRYILESSLLSYSLIDELDSKMAAASLLLAMKMKKLSWNATLEFYTGYKESELIRLMYQLNKVIATSTKYLTVKNKYLDKVYFEVAKCKPLEDVDI